VYFLLVVTTIATDCPEELVSKVYWARR